MLYAWKVRLLKKPTINLIWRYWQVWRNKQIGDYNRLPELIGRYVGGSSFADIGCMWGVNGRFAFIAEEAGATEVKGVDVYGPTAEFEAERAARNSKVEFILGDITQVDTLRRIGVVDVVFCAGVLYHHPSPFDILVALRQLCRETLILRTSTIPELKGLPNAAVYFPMLKSGDRKLWNLRSLRVSHQFGITDDFQPDQGYGNWFWGLTPGCLKSMLQTAGFRIDQELPEAFAQTLICSPVETPFVHRLPHQSEVSEIQETASSTH